jgi:hypothetical protein
MAVIAQFRDLADAEVASASLDAAGIPNEISDSQTIGVAWNYSNALGGIRLHVAEPVADEARAVLAEATEVEWPELPDGAADERCPACGRYALELDSGPRKTLALMTTLSLPVPIWFWRSKLRCRVCGFRSVVPLEMRPELVLVWILTGVAVIAVIAGLLLAVGTVVAMFARVFGFRPDGRIL